jgi:hypothetical protein
MTFGGVMKIVAPWSDETVAALNHFQLDLVKGRGLAHGYTCGNEHPDTVLLVATPNGWLCPVLECRYVQDWAIG